MEVSSPFPINQFEQNVLPFSVILPITIWLINFCLDCAKPFFLLNFDLLMGTQITLLRKINDQILFRFKSCSWENEHDFPVSLNFGVYFQNKKSQVNESWQYNKKKKEIKVC